MKLFQQLLVAPAALGLMAPVAATAAELNINDVSEYSNSSEVQSISQFSDVYPTDWAYQALTNLAERHGCVAASPNGSMTRYEAAALLNKCLGNVAQVNEEERRLLNEFGPELAVIKGRIDGLEARVGEFEAGVFSTTTKLSGLTTFVVGSASEAGQEGVTFNYDTRIALASSFRGTDTLKTVLRAGNFDAAGPFRNDALLEVASDADDSLDIVRNYYQFPVGEDFTATVGAIVRQDDMLGVWPSAYPNDSVLDVLTYAGANDVYALAQGAGAGITYAKDNISASFLFVSDEANTASAGLGTTEGSDDITAQLAYLGDNYTVALGITKSDGGVNTEDGDGTATVAEKLEDCTAWGLSGIYEIDSIFGLDSQYLPTSVSAGVGFKSPTNDNEDQHVEDETTFSVGFLWDDFVTDGNTLGLAYGTAEGHRDDDKYDYPMAFEMYYSMQVSDSITVTPAIFSVERNDSPEDVYGALVKTTFSF
jgi:hypothetical protein